MKRAGSQDAPSSIRRPVSYGAARGIALWIALGVLVASLAGNLLLHPVPLYGTETDLLAEYIPAARELDRLEIDPRHFTTKGPGYPALLALTAPLARGDMFLAARVINAVAAALAVWLTFLLFASLLDAWTALAVSLGLVVNPWFIRAVLEAGTDLPTLSVVLGALCLIIGSTTAWGLLLAGALAGFAVLSRSNYIFLPVAGALTLLAHRGQKRLAGCYGLGFAIPVVSWLGLCRLVTGTIPHDTNYLSMAYAIYGSRQSWEDFQTNSAAQFHSYFDVFALRPALALGVVAANAATRWLKDASQLLIWPLGVLAVGGIARSWPRQSRSWVLWINTLPAYALLCLAFYSPRFSLFLLPYYLSGACLLLLRPPEPSMPELARHGARQRLWRTAGPALLVILYSASAIVAVRQARALLSQTPYVVRDLGVALRHLDPTDGRLMARKPHVAYFGDKEHVPMPRLSSITDLIRAANREGARYISVSSGEATLRPEYSVLTDSGVVLPGLRQVIYRRDRSGASGAVYAVEAPTSRRSPGASSGRGEPCVGPGRRDLGATGGGRDRMALRT